MGCTFLHQRELVTLALTKIKFSCQNDTWKNFCISNLESLILFTYGHEVIVVQDILEQIRWIADGASHSFPNIMHNLLPIRNEGWRLQFQISPQSLFPQPFHIFGACNYLIITI